MDWNHIDHALNVYFIKIEKDLRCEVVKVFNPNDAFKFRHEVSNHKEIRTFMNFSIAPLWLTSKSQ